MTCYHPIAAYQASESPEGTSARAIRFTYKRGYTPLDLPCGKCIGCRLDRSRQWALRCVHHSKTRAENCFLTLTYDDEHLPYGNTLFKCHVQKFIRRLRKSIYPKEIEYFAVGEYGEESGRAHYHAIIFNHDFPKDSRWKRSPAGTDCYLSSALQKLWPYGRATVGAMTFESAAYCARYVMKKVNGPKASSHYTQIVPETGEIIRRLPEFVLMSLKRPIGKEFQTCYKSDIYPSDFCVVRGKKMKPPRYYDKQLSEIEKEVVKTNRREFAKTKSADNTPARLLVREECKKAQVKQLKRNLQS